MPSADFWVGPPAAPDTYRLVTLLGGGGEGEVWQAVLPLSAGGRSTVAVKILSTDGESDADSWKRFGHLLRSLSHPGLVRVTEVFTGPLRHREANADPATRANYVVMDYIDGPTLREWCDENPDATASQRLRMLRTVASALDEMHSGTSTQIPVAHGDVKPANVVVRDGTGTVLVDLGLARLTDATGVSGRSTPYAAPELRAPGALSTPEADRYAFAITTAQVLTGQPPPTGPDGWIDRPALESLLRASPITGRRPLLVRQVLEAITAPPEARPRQLRLWLDSAADTLSQVTTNGEQSPQEPLTRRQAAVTDVSPMSAGAPSTLLHQPEQPPPPRRRRRRWPLVIVAVLVIIGAATGVAAAVLRTPAPAAQGQLPSTTTTASSTATSTPTPTPTPTSGVARPSTQSLTVLQPVETNYRNARDGSNGTGVARIDGTTYPRAVRMSASRGCANYDGGIYWVDYSVDRTWDTFDAIVGLTDESSQEARVTYTLLGDGAVIASGPLSVGAPATIHVPITGVLRLRLLMQNPATAAGQSCTGNNHEGVVAWGEPTLS